MGPRLAIRMWVFRRSILSEMTLVSDGMAFSEEIKIEALKSSKVRFTEISIHYTRGSARSNSIRGATAFTTSGSLSVSASPDYADRGRSP